MKDYWLNAYKRGKALQCRIKPRPVHNGVPIRDNAKQFIGRKVTLKPVKFITRESATEPGESQYIGEWKLKEIEDIPRMVMQSDHIHKFDCVSWVASGDVIILGDSE